MKNTTRFRLLPILIFIIFLSNFTFTPASAVEKDQMIFYAKEKIDFIKDRDEKIYTSTIEIDDPSGSLPEKELQHRETLDGSEEVTLAIKNIEDGWNSLGSYYFTKGRASIQLSDKNVGRMVIADAVKWVKQ